MDASIQSNPATRTTPSPSTLSYNILLLLLLLLCAGCCAVFLILYFFSTINLFTFAIADSIKLHRISISYLLPSWLCIDDEFISAKWLSFVVFSFSLDQSVSSANVRLASFAIILIQITCHMRMHNAYAYIWNRQVASGEPKDLYTN